jgi:uncharacterized protein (TIGR03663 family)
MKNRTIASVIVILAIVMRFFFLADRPMHTDEAVNAFKLADLLENGTFIYDKNEYHGPTIYFLSVLPAWLKSQNNLASLDEKTLRSVPALAGVAIILLMLFLVKPLGWPVVLVSMLLMALSPALVFYSRYYIHELFLILFNAGLILSLYRYSRSFKPGWILLSGIFAGLMFSTKETWIILAGSQFAAFLVVNYRQLRSLSFLKKKWDSTGFVHLILFILPAAIVAVLLFSSFFKNPGGIADSAITYRSYFTRASAEAVHVHPWYYYFSAVVFNSCNGLFFRADLWLIAGGLSGMIMVFILPPAKVRNRPVILFAAVTTILTAVIFSAIPYKTPWNILPFYTPLVFLAAWFLITIPEKIKSGRLKTLYLILSVAITIHLGWQVYADNFKFNDQQCNPYVYSHPGEDVYGIMQDVEKIADSAPEGRDIFIEVIVSGDGYWPLPWYMRSYSNTGWWNEVDLNAPAAPLIICDRANSNQLTKKLFEIPEPGKRFLYIPVNEEKSLRPGTHVTLYLRKDYWDRYINAQTL